MKKLLLSSTTALALGAGAAQAEVMFENGEFSVGFGIINDSEVTMIDVGGQVAFSVGNLGFQIDAGMDGITDFNALQSFGDFGLHFYKTTANGNKFGGYLATTYYFNEVGAEAMLALGPVDVEVSIGVFDQFFSSSSVYSSTLDVFFEVTPALELNAGVDIIFDGEFSETIYEVGGSYKLANNGLSLNLGYTGYDGEGSINAGVSWSFGPNQDSRLFGDRGFDIFFGPT